MDKIIRNVSNEVIDLTCEINKRLIDDRELIESVRPDIDLCNSLRTVKSQLECYQGTITKLQKEFIELVEESNSLMREITKLQIQPLKDEEDDDKLESLLLDLKLTHDKINPVLFLMRTVQEGLISNLRGE